MGEGELVIYRTPVKDREDYDTEGRSLPMRTLKKICLALDRGETEGLVLRQIEWWRS
jgi:hypothetical protein